MTSTSYFQVFFVATVAASLTAFTLRRWKNAYNQDQRKWRRATNEELMHIEYRNGRYWISGRLSKYTPAWKDILFPKFPSQVNGMFVGMPDDFYFVAE